MTHLKFIPCRMKARLDIYGKSINLQNKFKVVSERYEDEWIYKTFGNFFDAPLLMSTPSKKSLKAQRCLSKRKQCLLVHFGEMDSIWFASNTGALLPEGKTRVFVMLLEIHLGQEEQQQSFFEVPHPSSCGSLFEELIYWIILFTIIATVHKHYVTSSFWTICVWFHFLFFHTFSSVTLCSFRCRCQWDCRWWGSSARTVDCRLSTAPSLRSFSWSCQGTPGTHTRQHALRKTSLPGSFGQSGYEEKTDFTCLGLRHACASVKQLSNRAVLARKLDRGWRFCNSTVLRFDAGSHCSSNVSWKTSESLQAGLEMLNSSLRWSDCSGGGDMLRGMAGMVVPLWWTFQTSTCWWNPVAEHGALECVCT